jgi:hypothetical protein
MWIAPTLQVSPYPICHKAFDLVGDRQTVPTANPDRNRQFAPERVGLPVAELVQAFEQRVGGRIHATEIIRSGDHERIGFDEFLSKRGHVVL